PEMRPWWRTTRRRTRPGRLVSPDPRRPGRPPTYRRRKPGGSPRPVHRTAGRTHRGAGFGEAFPPLLREPWGGRGRQIRGVGPAAPGVRGEEGCVGLHHEVAQRCLDGGCSHVLGVAGRSGTGEREIVAAPHAFGRHRRIT